MKSDDDTVGDIFSIVTKYCIREQENIIIQERLIYKLGVIETLWTKIKNTNKNFSFKLAIYHLKVGTMSSMLGWWPNYEIWLTWKYEKDKCIAQLIDEIF